MKRAGMILFVVLILFQGFITADAAVYEKDIVYSEAGVNASYDVWGGYLFAASESGIEIIDLMTDKTVAKWKLNSTVVPGGGATINPTSIKVNDDYIIATIQTKHLLVFPNEGVYTNTPPTLIRRLGKFNLVPRIALDGDTIYIADVTASGTISGVSKGNLVCWKVDLSAANNFSYNGSAANKYTVLSEASMLENGYSEYSILSTADNLWAEIENDENYIYFVTFNNTTAEPYKKLYLHKVNKETLEDTTCVLYDDELDGMVVELTFEDVKTANDIKEMEVYDTANPDTKVALSRFGTYAKIVITNNTAGGCTAKIYLTNFNIIKSRLNIEKEALTGETAFIGITVNEEETLFKYNSNNTVYSSGAIAMADGKVYVCTNVPNQYAVNYCYVVNVEEVPVLEREEVMAGVGYYGRLSGYQDLVSANGKLIGFVTNVSYSATVLDFENYGNVSDTIAIPGAIVTANEFSKAVVYGSRIYYPLSTSTGASAIGGIEVVYESGVKADTASYPVVVYGTGEGAVTAKLGGIEYEAGSENGAWRVVIHKAPEDVTTAEITTSNEVLTVDLPAEVNREIEISYVVLNGTTLTFDVVNNTDEYKNIQTMDITFVAAVYDANGKMKDSAETRGVYEYGEIANAEITDIEVADGDSVILYALSKDGVLLSDAYDIIQNTEIATDEIIIAEDAEVTAEITPNMADKTLKIAGQYLPGRRAMVTVTRTVGKTTEVMGYYQTVTDADGNYSVAYSYACDMSSAETIYGATVKFTDAGNEAEIAAPDESEYIAAIKEVKELRSKTEVLAYLKANPEFAKVLGVDVEADVFKGLNKNRQESLAELVLNNIKNETEENIPAAYEEKLAQLSVDQRKDDALTSVQNATASSLTGILEKYKDVYGISDALWTKYEKTGSDMPDVNAYFIKKAKIVELTDVPTALTKAINSLDDKPPINTGSGGSRGNSYQVPVTETTLNNPVPSLFDDLEGYPWATDSITYLYGKGVINGTGNRIFAPSENVTREQFVKMLVIALDIETEDKSCNFTDVDKNGWAYPYIAAAYESGIAMGYNGEFGGSDFLTREDAAVLIERAVKTVGKGIPEIKEATPFIDEALISDYAKSAVTALNRANIINGDGNSFNPKGSCNRAMAAKMIFEMLNSCR